MAGPACWQPGSGFVSPAPAPDAGFTVTVVQPEAMIWTSLPGRRAEGFYSSLCAPSFGWVAANLCHRAAPNQRNEAAKFVLISFHPAYVGLP